MPSPTKSEIRGKMRGFVNNEEVSIAEILQGAAELSENRADTAHLHESTKGDKKMCLASK